MVMKIGRRKFRKEPPQVAKDVYQYICDNPGCTAGMIAEALNFKHKNYAHQIIGSLESYDGMLVSQDNDVNFRFYPFNLEELDNSGWISD